MTPDNRPTPPPHDDEGPLRPHVYDGIMEYNKRLPNWWLATFYGAIIFAVGYYSCFEWWKVLPNQAQIVNAEMARIDAAKLASVANLSDDTLYAMSRNPTIVEAGHATFLANCAACHRPDLSGNIGPPLIKQKWIHGGHPMEIYHTVTTGVKAKGMPTWGPILGPKTISQVVAFVLSMNKKPPLN